MPAHNKVCVLSSLELAEWRTHNIQPNCTDHQHVKAADAKQMAWPDWQMKEKIFFDQTAEFVGPHHIILYGTFTWQRVRKSAGIRIETLQLKPGVVGGGRHSAPPPQSTNGFPARMNNFRDRQAVEEKFHSTK